MDDRFIISYQEGMVKGLARYLPILIELMLLLEDGGGREEEMKKV